MTDFGENRDQEAAPKAAEVAAAFAAAGMAAPPPRGDVAHEPAGKPVTWHFIGQLQTNKARSVAPYADAVHSVDRIRLVHALGAAARAAGRDADLPRPGEPRPGRRGRAPAWRAAGPTAERPGLARNAACRARRGLAEAIAAEPGLALVA